MTEVHIVELAALIQTEHESDVLSRLMATGMQPVTTAYRYMTEATLDGVIVHDPVNYTLAPPPPVR